MENNKEATYVAKVKETILEFMLNKWNYFSQSIDYYIIIYTEESG